jgi:hypothetical protein
MNIKKSIDSHGIGMPIVQPASSPHNFSCMWFDVMSQCREQMLIQG